MENKRYYWCVILILLLIQCFGVTYLSPHFLYYLFVPIVLLFVLKQRGSVFGYKRLLYFYFVCILFSCIYSFLYNQQNLLKTFVASYDFFGILSVFMILNYRLSYQQTTKLIKFIGILFCCCYILQWVIYPYVIFAGASDEVNISSSFFRMRMSGSIASFCLYFYGLNKFLLDRKLKNVFFMILGFFPIIIMGFRSLTTLTLVSTFFLIAIVVKDVKKIFLFVGYLFIIGMLSSNIPVVEEKINEMLNRHESNQSFSNEDYIRYAELDFFQNEVFVKPLERFVGGGMPVFDNNVSHSKYVSIMKKAYDYDFYWVDLGIVGLSFIIGIPAVLLLVIIILRCAILCKDRELQYIRFTLLVVLLGSLFTSKELFRTGNMVIIGIFLYLEYIRNKELKLKLLDEKSK